MTLVTDLPPLSLNFNLPPHGRADEVSEPHERDISIEVLASRINLHNTIQMRITTDRSISYGQTILTMFRWPAQVVLHTILLVV